MYITELICKTLPDKARGRQGVRLVKSNSFQKIIYFLEMSF